MEPSQAITISSIMVIIGIFLFLRLIFLKIKESKKFKEKWDKCVENFFSSRDYSGEAKRRKKRKTYPEIGNSKKVTFVKNYS